MAITTAELCWLRMLLKNLKVVLSNPPRLWCDNLGAIALVSNPIYHARIKHIEVDYYFIREKYYIRILLLVTYPQQINMQTFLQRDSH